MRNREIEETQKQMNSQTESIRSSQDPAQYWEQRLSTLKGLDGVGFIGLGLAFNEWMYRVRRRVFLREVVKITGNSVDGNVLDIGSGTGFWLKVWSSQGAKNLTGSDLTKVATEDLKLKYPQDRILQLDITSPETSKRLNETFNYISAIDVLFHITSDDGFSTAIANISKLLKKNGYFIFSENLPHERKERAVTQVNRTLEKVTGELDGNGLRIVSRVPMFVLMNAPIDSNWKPSNRLWQLFMMPLHFFPVLGHVYGTTLYPFEILLTRLLSEGPSTELVICQKI